MKNNWIFVNCPYDNEYIGLFNAIIFTVIVLGFIPQAALQDTDGAKIRIEKIVELIEKSKYSIHDISRLVAEEKGEFYRLNMPFELGIDYGAKRFKNECLCKKFLILEKNKYDYRKAISDISGMDIEAHNNNAATIIECVRNWLVKNTGIKNVPASKRIKDDYFEKFQLYFFDKAMSLGYAEYDYINKITYTEYLDFISEWLLNNRTYANTVVQE
jgi:hypothetical protein